MPQLPWLLFSRNVIYAPDLAGYLLILYLLIAYRQRMVTALFIKGMRMIKYLSILVVVSTLLISGCIDLHDTSSANSRFYGTWEYPCEIRDDGTGSYGGTLEISSETLISAFFSYENENCTGNTTSESQFEFQIRYGERVITPSGIEATELDLSIVFDDELVVFLDLIYRNGNQLYLGNIETGETRTTDINFDRYYTLK